MTRRTLPGFTLLEILVVLAVMGILATVAVYSLNVTRAGARDAKRVSDVSVLRSGLTQYWLQKASYPQNAGVSLGKAGQGADGLTTNGFVGNEGGGTVILERLPIGPKPGEYYFYKGTNGGYSLQFTTERETAYGAAGTYYAHSVGVDRDAAEK